MCFLLRTPPRELRPGDHNDARDGQWAPRVGMAGANRNQRGNLHQAGHRMIGYANRTYVGLFKRIINLIVFIIGTTINLGLLQFHHSEVALAVQCPRPRLILILAINMVAEGANKGETGIDPVAPTTHHPTDTEVEMEIIAAAVVVAEAIEVEEVAMLRLLHLLIVAEEAMGVTTTVEEEDKISREDTLILDRMDHLQPVTIVVVAAAAAKPITDLLLKVDIVIKDHHSSSNSRDILLQE